MKLPIDVYWKKIVDVYYYDDNILARGAGHQMSIWDWLLEDYNAKRRINFRGHNESLEFEDDIDAVAFKLRFG